MKPIRRNKTKTADVFLAITSHLSPICPDGENVVFSPFCLQALLSLIAAGASDPAAKQVLSFLKSDSIDDLNALFSNLLSEVLADDGVADDRCAATSGYDSGESYPPELSFANGIWIQDGLSLKHSFKQVVDNVYNADLHQSDFPTPDEIVSQVNSWAAEKTNGLISNLLPPGSVSKNGRLILANALYFKASWPDDYFRPFNTKDNDFHLLYGSSVKVPFMTNSRHSLSIGTFDGFKVLCLCYDQGYNTQFSMYILLPDSVDGLAALVERACSEPDFLEHHLKVRTVDAGEFRIPKFKILFGFQASKTLRQLGVTLSFEVGALSETADSAEKLFVSEIYHKSFIEVNKEGTLAAAASATEEDMGFSLFPPEFERVDFVADHPFMFLIREERSGAVLFLGHVLNPSKEY